MRVKFRVGTFGQEFFIGTVDAVRPMRRNNNNVVTYPVWIRVPNPDLRLRPGMTASVTSRSRKRARSRGFQTMQCRFRPTRAVYVALGVPAPEIETVRAVDLAGDRVVDPTALRPATPRRGSQHD